MVNAVQQLLSGARGLASSLFLTEQRRRKSRAFSLSAESCEMRCLPAPLGAAPQLSSTQVNPTSITGMVVDDGSANEYTVDMDLYNDGTIDQTLTTNWNHILNGASWQWIIPGGMIGIEDVEVGLTPRESNGAASHTGAKIVVVIPGIPNSAPEFETLNITETHVSGMIDDDTLTQGNYVIEAAFGTTEGGFQTLGEVNSLGIFTLTHTFEYNDGTIPVYIRIRETHSFDQLTSEVATRYYTSSDPYGGGSSGTGAGGAGAEGGGSLFGGDDDDDFLNGLFG